MINRTLHPVTHCTKQSVHAAKGREEEASLADQARSAQFGRSGREAGREDRRNAVALWVSDGSLTITRFNDCTMAEQVPA